MHILAGRFWKPSAPLATPERKENENEGEISKGGEKGAERKDGDGKKRRE